MAKFCSKCGSEITGNVKFCSKCGAPVPGAAQGAGGAQGYGGTQGAGGAQGYGGTQGAGGAQNYGNYGAAAPARKKSIIPVFAIGAAAVLVVVFIFVKIFGGGNYKSPIEKLEKGMNNQDVKLMSEAFIDGEGIADSEAADLFSSFGGIIDYEIKLDVVGEKKLDKSAIVQVLTEDYYVDAVYASQAKAAYILEVKMTMKMGEYSEDNTDEIPVAKIDGKWVIPMSLNDL